MEVLFPAAEHFNLPDHNNIHDKRVPVVRQFKTLAPSGMNVNFKFIKLSRARIFLKSHVHHKTRVYSLTLDSGLMAVIFSNG